MKIIIVKGDITEALVDSIVCAANSRLSPSSGECGAIFNSAGYESLKNELKGNPYCAPGNAIITPGFNLCKYIIHAVGPIYKEDKRDDDLLLSAAYINSLNLAISNKCLTIAFPALSTGIYNYPYDLAADIAISTLYEYKKIHDNDIANVYIYCYDDEIYKAFKDAHYKYVNDWKRNVSDIVKLTDTLKDRDTRVQSFKNTRELYLNDKYLKKCIKYTKKNTKLYLEDFKSENKAIKNGELIFERKTSINSSKAYLGSGKLGILNFANGIHPGGGILTGSNAQEESICRLSTLYISLNDETGSLYEGFYGYNREIGYLSSDRIIYSPDIVIFKDDDKENTLLSKDDWYNVNIISCAAPNLKENNISDLELYNVILKRIRNIFEVSIENDIDILILGAFGCGSFNNNPYVNSCAFKVLIEEYLKYFKKIIFAIPDEKDEESSNFKVFYNALCS